MRALRPTDEQLQALRQIQDGGMKGVPWGMIRELTSLGFIRSEKERRRHGPLTKRAETLLAEMSRR